MSVADFPSLDETGTGKLYLRPLAQSDATLYCDLYTDAETMRFIGAPLSPRRALNSFRKALQRTQRRPLEWLLFAAIDRATEQAIGVCSIEPRGDRAETGVILCAASRAQGYAKEAMTATIGLAFAIFPIDAVLVRISAQHRVAERVARGLGFSRGADATDRDTSHVGRTWSIDRHAWDHAHRSLPVPKHLHESHRST